MMCRFVNPNSQVSYRSLVLIIPEKFISLPRRVIGNLLYIHACIFVSVLPLTVHVLGNRGTQSSCAVMYPTPDLLQFGLELTACVGYR
jgi:hypothetical protein